MKTHVFNRPGRLTAALLLSFWILGIQPRASADVGAGKKNSAFGEPVPSKNTVGDLVVASNYSFFPEGWVLSPAGKVSFCQTVINGTSGAPMSQCLALGSIGTTSAMTTILSTNSQSLWAVNNQAATIINCTTILRNGTTPIGGCVVVSTLAALQ